MMKMKLIRGEDKNFTVEFTDDDKPLKTVKNYYERVKSITIGLDHEESVGCQDPNWFINFSSKCDDNDYYWHDNVNAIDSIVINFKRKK